MAVTYFTFIFLRCDTEDCPNAFPEKPYSGSDRALRRWAEQLDWQVRKNGKGKDLCPIHKPVQTQAAS